MCISLPDVDAYVMVLQAVEPQITLHGTDRIWRPTAQFESTKGVTLFPDIKIVSTFTKAEDPGDLKTTGTGTHWVGVGGTLNSHVKYDSHQSHFRTTEILFTIVG